MDRTEALHAAWPSGLKAHLVKGKQTGWKLQLVFSVPERPHVYENLKTYGAALTLPVTGSTHDQYYKILMTGAT